MHQAIDKLGKLHELQYVSGNGPSSLASVTDICIFQLVSPSRNKASESQSNCILMKTMMAASWNGRTALVLPNKPVLAGTSNELSIYLLGHVAYSSCMVFWFLCKMQNAGMQRRYQTKRVTVDKLKERALTRCVSGSACAYLSI